ncbi:MAG: ATP-binding cassette domain-containing protein [Gemmatimonas sp.]|nr:ATP-binding cassette domain-containing protein [Gemmatimonas sp.]
MTDRSAPEEERSDRAYDAALTGRLLRYASPYRAQIAIAILLLMGGAAVEMVGPYLTKVAIDQAIPENDIAQLVRLVLLFLGSILAAFLFEYLQTLLTTWIGQRVMNDLRMELFRHLQGLSLRFFDRNPVGRLMTRVTNDVETLNELFSSGVVTVFGDLFTVLFIVIAMFLLDWRLAMVTLAVLPFVFLAAFVFRGLIRKASWEIRIRLARINAFLQERITGIRVVQLFGREDDTARRFESVNRDHLQANLHAIRYYALFFPIIEVLTAVAFALILWYGGLSILQGTMTVGVVAAFLQYGRRFFRPIQDLSEKYNLLQGAVASSERIFRLLDTPPDVVDVEQPLPLPAPGNGEIEFRDVWFHYGSEPTPEQSSDKAGEPERGDAWVLRGVSFCIRPGDRVAVVGATGSGKSTIINLLMRFYEPQRGGIFFDGVPISQVRTSELRDRIGLVLQDVFLFSEDIRSNIDLGRSESAVARAETAARRVGADTFIRRLPDGYDHVLGERGASISVGERQLVSFARALAFDPLVLVLDEATSSVDSELEARIDEALKELMRGRTTLVVAHRLSTVQSADQILVLHHGEIREHGTHAELLRTGGLYSRLHELQFAAGPEARASGKALRTPAA